MYVAALQIRGKNLILIRCKSSFHFLFKVWSSGWEFVHCPKEQTLISMWH